MYAEFCDVMMPFSLKNIGDPLEVFHRGSNTIVTEVLIDFMYLIKNLNFFL